MVNTTKLKAFDRDWQYERDNTVPLYSVKGAFVDDDVIHEFIDWGLVWCVKKFGCMDKKPIPEVKWCTNAREMQSKGFIGFYDYEDNEIVIRITGHRNFYNLIETLIHEYIHYLQPTSGGWYERYYKQYNYKYNNHPHEVEAYYLSEIYTVDAYDWIVNKMTKTLEQKGIL